jgi:hypothetical protein
VVFRFGLPQVPEEKRWEEKGVLRTQWLTNGVRYTQTVLLTEASLPSAVASSNPLPILLVNIEGDNTSGEYTEAAAELAVEIDGKPQSLLLQAGLVWRVAGETRSLLGALEIADSGIKEPRGDRLKFSGNMPPSLKGSMTLKIPRRPLAEQESPDWLTDLEFDAALRRVLREPTNGSTNRLPVIFARE